ncbi:NADH-quinone oxidoreductase subunit N [Actinomadura montaniterrae]|uniref:NADH-quinone oxidoreductase subunit N n=1 Tax=Actinomadura montaniterrae TaxID=1803903 RepID=A0A6L3VYZ1_9ACTN|nr:NADH-quinone oxidoreductase subunit N [Actinomadura montaniterrae]KAB2387786.1 NADH-quinone oxidoreductase subunit N [Actinomadura montaniterrae]
MIQGIDYAAIAPPLIVAAAALALLLADAFDAPRRVLGLACGGSLGAALVAVIALAPGDRRATFCVPASLRGGGPRSCSYVTDDFTLLFQGIVLAAALVVVLLSLQEITDAEIPAGEYHFLLLCAVIGALTLVAARDLVLLLVALETLSLPVFALVGLRRYDGRASEAALKLFLVSVVSTAIMLFGISLVYGTTGAMHLDRIAPALDRVPSDLDPVAAVGAVLVLAGFAFKVAAVPFHFWAPDVYNGAPLPVAAFLSVVSKAAGFAGLAIVLALGLPAYGHVWGPVIGVLAALTMTLGNLVALRQRTAIRLLAWSSVAQSGYMLAPLSVGSHRLPEAVAATTAYVALYAVMNLGAFTVVIGFARRGLRGARPHRDTLDGFRGLAHRSPATATALAFFLICLAGLPPGVMGLFAKVVVFRSTVAGGVTWLAVIMAINTVIGLYYYLAWAVRLFTPPVRPFTDPLPGWPVRAALAATAAGAVVLSIAPQIVLQTVSAAT